MPRGKPGTLTHGLVAYSKGRCKCSVCRDAMTAWRRAKYGQRPREVVNAEREAPHGTETRRKRCNCQTCIAGASAARSRRRRENGPGPSAIHGKASTYKNGCRCDLCRTANSIDSRDRKRRARAAA